VQSIFTPFFLLPVVVGTNAGIPGVRGDYLEGD